MTEEPKPRRSRWWLAGGVALAVVVLTVTTVTIVYEGIPGLWGDKCASDGYEQADLSSAPMDVVAISPNGEYLVGSPDKTGTTGFGLWHDGEYRLVEDLPGESVWHSEVFDVNDSGVVLGESETDGDPVRWTYADGEFTRLKGLAGSSSTLVVALNNAGTVIGYAEEDAGERPVVWKDGKTSPSPLDLPEGHTGYVHNISEDGSVVGTVAPDADSGGVAWLWRNAEGEGLELLPEADFGDGKGGSAVSDAIAIAGDWVLVTGRPETIRINIADGYRADALSIGGANAIDEFGRVFTTRKGLPVVYDDKPYPLPGMSKPPNKDTEDGYEEDPAANVVLAAAEDGSVVYGKSFHDDRVLWTCR